MLKQRKFAGHANVDSITSSAMCYRGRVMKCTYVGFGGLLTPVWTAAAAMFISEWTK